MVYVFQFQRERKKDKAKLKLRKENGLPNSLLQAAEPAKKRSKLVLPDPQISDQDMQQVIKLGKASDTAREIVSESGIETTDALLGDYTLNPQTTATPRTPSVASDRLMREADTIMALTHVETPLKGGVNTPLHNMDFTTTLPTSLVVATPNTVLATPFRMNRELEASATPSFQTPGSNDKNQTPLPARDKLNINIEEGSIGAQFAIKKHQKIMKDLLRDKLSTLPTPKNDYEIVVPEDIIDDVGDNTSSTFIEDQSDHDLRVVKEKQLHEIAEMARRSQVIQKNLPRPIEINTTILRPPTDMIGLTDLQRAEELIKQEMITMLHYDAMLNPVSSRLNALLKKQPPIQHYQSYLRENQYYDFESEELANANSLLENEMKVVKSGMAHGDLSLENYSQVWQECLSQVLFLPSQNRYTRANLASKKDRFEAAERKLEQNRKHMAKEAKRCGKIEKKMKILTGGYQVRLIIICTDCSLFHQERMPNQR